MNYQNNYLYFKNDTISESINQLNKVAYDKKFKSPGKALLLSGVLPGTGQIYTKKWLRGLFFIALDGLAIHTWYRNNKQAEIKKNEYSNYAFEHWDFARWIHDYYKWYPDDAPNDFNGGIVPDDFSGTQLEWNQSQWDILREVFVNKSDTLYNCHEYPYCYIDIWEHSHSVEFSYNKKIYSTSSDDFKLIYKDICNNNYIGDTKCTIDLEDMNMVDSNGDTIIARTSHHFYEGIQKYDMFFAGWDDNDSAWVVIKENNDQNITSLNQSNYRDLWGEYNNIKTLAGNGGKFMLINRLVSMIDAILLAKKWNNQHDVKLSLNAYPNLRNNTGLGEVRLSMYFN